MRRPIGLLAMVTALLGVGVVAPVASASIAMGQSIDGVKLGETLAQLRARFPHVRVEKNRGETSFSVPNLRGGLSSHGVITSFYTASALQKTSKGIHTANPPSTRGSSEVAVRKAYPSAKCNKPGFPEPDSIICTVKSRYRGRVVTTSFTLQTPSEGVGEIAIQFG